MPRQARVDVPGQCYHVMSRGIERREIFNGEEDYTDFIGRFQEWLNKFRGKCLAWCLMPNHFHFVVIRGTRPLSELMHHVMTGYAVNFNLRRGRAGHLFQNRYKAIICGFDEYFMQLVPYIHLNPLRSGLVRDLGDLVNYKWCGHAALATGGEDGVIDKQELLQHFGDSEAAALSNYARLMVEKAKEHGLAAPSARQGEQLWALRKAGACGRGMFGGDDFVEGLLKADEKTIDRESKSRAELLAEVSRLTGIQRAEILRPSRNRESARARAIYCYLCKEEAGVSGPELMAELKINQSGISKLINKGRDLIKPVQLGI